MSFTKLENEAKDILNELQNQTSNISLTSDILSPSSSSSVSPSSSSSSSTSPTLSMDSKNDNPKKIVCAVMIVRNESKVIERCLSHILPHIDTFSICDTGSTDDTVDKIVKFAQKNNLPGCVYNNTWRHDFGSNRNMSMLHAKITLLKMGINLENAWFLCVDADLNLHTRDNLPLKNFLTDKSRFINHCYNNSCHTQICDRVFKASLDVECVGQTHEWYKVYGETVHWNDAVLKLKDVWIDDRADGGCKDNKYTRDVLYLKQMLEREPDNNRYMAYLAKTYMWSNQFSEAIPWFIKRIKSGEDDPQNCFHEERHESMMNLARCYKSIGDVDKTKACLEKAYLFMPTRNEASIALAEYYHSQKAFELCYMWAELARKNPLPEQVMLGLDASVYTWKPLYYVLIGAYHAGEKERGKQACKDLIKLNAPMPDTCRSYAREVLEQYYQ